MTSDHAKITLRSLQVFEAAARRGSFTGAGEELGISQSAVSRQISDLEALLALKLFHRNGARILITAAGETLANQLKQSFNDIWSAVSSAKRSEQIVTISMLPSLATRWFAPRLGRFMAQHPDIDLRITASRHFVDFLADGVDAAVRYTKRPDQSLASFHLGSETVRPVCAPPYAEQMGLEQPRDLYRATLLYGDIAEDWPSWFQAAGCAEHPPPGPRLGDDSAILQAAFEGQGVALGRSRLVASDVAAGRLMAPYTLSLPASFSYWFVSPKALADAPNLKRVCAWFKAEFDEQA